MNEYLPVTEAAARLGISERTLRRRIKAGEVLTRKVARADGGGVQLLIEIAGATANRASQSDSVPANAPDTAPAIFESESDSATAKVPNVPAKSETVPDSVPANRAGHIATDLTAALLAEKDARIDDLRAQVEAWRLQAEAANRTAAETSAALRKALDAMPKAITAGDKLGQVGTENTSRENAPQVPISTIGDQTNSPDKQGVTGKPTRKTLTPWQRVAARILKIR